MSCYTIPPHASFACFLQCVQALGVPIRSGDGTSSTMLVSLSTDEYASAYCPSAPSPIRAIGTSRQSLTRRWEAMRLCVCTRVVRPTFRNPRVRHWTLAIRPSHQTAMYATRQFQSDLCPDRFAAAPFGRDILAFGKTSRQDPASDAASLRGAHRYVVLRAHARERRGKSSNAAKLRGAHVYAGGQNRDYTTH